MNAIPPSLPYRFCCYCKRKMRPRGAKTPSGSRVQIGLCETRDHMTPKTRAGRFIVPCCRACNELKGDMTIEQWDAFRPRVPRWWTLFEDRGPRGVRLYALVVEANRPLS